MSAARTSTERIGIDLSLRRELDALLEAERKTTSFLEKPCFDIPELPDEIASEPSGMEPDTVLSDRFKILRLLGTGGMGHVYEALDTELNVHVALKTIRQEISQNVTILAQFRQEVRLARRITHPNVCRIFELQRRASSTASAPGTAPELMYLTMEYLDGENLRQRLKRRNARPQEEALHIGRQLAEALCAAHVTGVVHRDIKPANVMLVPSSGGDRAVITDFGLARFALASDSMHSAGLSKMGGIVGTPAYMAPEQLRGGTVTAATDIYAFGLVVCEMLTGTQANLEALADKESWLRQQPSIAALPAPWRVALDKCLNIVPQQRFQNAEELVAFLDDASRPKAARQFTRLQLWLGSAAIFLLCVSLSWLGYRLYQRGAEAKIAPGSTVLFSSIRNDTGDKTYDNVTSLMQNQLTQTARFNLLDTDRVHNILQQMTKAPDTPVTGAVAREIAMRAGAARVVSGTLSKGSTSQYTLAVTVEQPDNTPSRALHKWQKQWSWDAPASSDNKEIPAGLLSAVRDGGDWVRREVGESVNDIARLDAPPEDVTTGSWAALAEYTEAQRLYADSKPQEAVASLREAVKVDPQFALAWGRMGDILATTNQMKASYDAYTTALQVDQDRHLTRRERDRIKGSFASDTGDYAAAEAAFADMSSFYENDWLAWFYRARPLMMLGRPKEALHVLLKANELAPGNQFVLEHLVRAYFALNDFSGAQRCIAELRKDGYSDVALYNEGIIATSETDFGSAIHSFDALTTSSNVVFRSWSYAMLARAEAARGSLSQSVTYTTRGIFEDEQSGNLAARDQKLLDRAYLHCELADYELCALDASKSLSNDVPPLRLRWTAYLIAKYVPAVTGKTRMDFLATLQVVNSKLPNPTLGPSNQITVLQVNGLSDLAQGKRAAALIKLRAAAELDTPTSPREYLELAEGNKVPGTEANAGRIAATMWTLSPLTPPLTTLLPLQKRRTS